MAVAAVGVGLQVFGGGSTPGVDESTATAELDRSTSGTAEQEAAPAPDDAVPVVALGRALTGEDLDDLAAAPFAAAQDEASADERPAAGSDAGGDGPESGEAAAAQAAPEAPTVTDAARADVRRCLAEIGLRRGEGVPVTLAELATLDGDPVVIYRLAAPGGDTGILVVDQRTCATRFAGPTS